MSRRITLYRYSVKYRRDNASVDRVFHRTVTASDPDQARALVKIVDPHFIATVTTPRRMARLLVESEAHA